MLGSPDNKETKKNSSSSSSWWLLCSRNSICSSSSSSTVAEPDNMEGGHQKKKKKPGGWRAMPFILGNETFERLAVFGLFANFTVYMTRELHLETVAASNIMNIWFGITNFAE
ncbi:hypothetical protein K1719_017102 [Acacia pycnantha]|nr:hypothetical protein K1719_017102 [Acacia pycnantha]